MPAKAYWMQNPSSAIAEPRFCIQYALAGIYILRECLSYYYMPAKAYWMQNPSSAIAEPKFCNLGSAYLAYSKRDYPSYMPANAYWMQNPCSAVLELGFCILLLLPFVMVATVHGFCGSVFCDRRTQCTRLCGYYCTSLGRLCDMPLIRSAMVSLFHKLFKNKLS